MHLQPSLLGCGASGSTAWAAQLRQGVEAIAARVGDSVENLLERLCGVDVSGDVGHCVMLSTKYMLRLQSRRWLACW